jgi:hypothetical protein
MLCNDIGPQRSTFLYLLIMTFLVEKYISVSATQRPKNRRFFKLVSPPERRIKTIDTRHGPALVQPVADGLLYVGDCMSGCLIAGTLQLSFSLTAAEELLQVYSNDGDYSIFKSGTRQLSYGSTSLG